MRVCHNCRNIVTDLPDFAKTVAGFRAHSARRGKFQFHEE